MAITGVTAPVPDKNLVWSASCETAGVSSTNLEWYPNDYPAQYGKTYTARGSVWADSDHKFDDSTTATINGNPAVITGRSEYWLGVSYSFTTAKHDIQISFDNAVSDGDPAVTPTINAGYKFSDWRFYEDTNKDDDFTDDNTIILDEATLKAIAEEVGRTPEELIAYYASAGYTIKTTFTGGYTYGLFASIARSDRKSFAQGTENAVIDGNRQS